MQLTLQHELERFQPVWQEILDLDLTNEDLEFDILVDLQDAHRHLVQDFALSRNAFCQSWETIAETNNGRVTLRDLREQALFTQGSLTRAAMKEQTFKTQRTLTQLIDDQTLPSALRMEATTRLMSITECSTPGAGIVLQALPMTPETTFTNVEFQHHAHYQLVLQTSLEKMVTTCQCGKPMTFQHIYLCPKSGCYNTAHQDVQYLMHNITKPLPNLQPRLEPFVDRTTDFKRTDLILHNAGRHDENICFDVSTVNPICVSNRDDGKSAIYRENPRDKTLRLSTIAMLSIVRHARKKMKSDASTPMLAQLFEPGSNLLS